MTAVFNRVDASQRMPRVRPRKKVEKYRMPFSRSSWKGRISASFTATPMKKERIRGAAMGSSRQSTPQTTTQKMNLVFWGTSGG